jgi:GDP-D-mannose 3',5'-epimerase
MKFLVTGFAGMIGSNLVKKLLLDGHSVIGIDNYWRGSLDNFEKLGLKVADYDLISVEADLSLWGEWHKNFYNVDCVVHLADIVAGCGYVFNNEAFVFRQNLLINANVSKAVSMAKPTKYLYVGTACSFPAHLQSGVTSTPLSEEDQFPASPESAYGWSKLMGELDAKYLASYDEILTSTLILHNVYGWPCDYFGNKSQVLPALCYKALTSTDGILVVWGDGKQGRAFVHVDDVVRAIILGLEHAATVHQPIQIGPDICTAISEIADLLLIHCPNINSVLYDKSKPTGDLGRSANYTKAKTLLGWEPEIDISVGLKTLLKNIDEDIKRLDNFS